MNNEKVLVSLIAPIQTRSGYGDRARDIARAILSSDKYDLKIWSINWGNTSYTGLDPNDPEDVKILNCILAQPNLPRQPDIHIHISVPSEFQAIGKYNIGMTAGIETDHVDPTWIEGANRMDLVLVSSEHAKLGFTTTVYEKKNEQGQVISKELLKLEKPIEVLFEGADTTIFEKLSSVAGEEFTTNLDAIVKEDFAFLFVGHWLQGDIGQDRKDVGMLIRTFFEAFKNKKKRPALILKTSGVNSSLVDRKTILDKIDLIRKSMTDAKELPNVYLIHGDLTRKEMNILYNHPKVKAHISFTKGEGFGRPLLESTFSCKPLIVPKHSGYLDFLEHVVWLPGKLTPIHPSAQWQGVLNANTKWFTVDYGIALGLLKDIFENYKSYVDLGKRQAFISKTRFTLELMQKQLLERLDAIADKLPKQTTLALPKLKKVERKEEVKV